MFGLFDNLFDCNRDGKTDFDEEVLGMSMLMAMLDDDEKATGDDLDFEDE